MNNAISSQNITGAINQCIDQKLGIARFCTYARVVAVDILTCTLTAQPLVAEAINTANQKKSYRQLPPIQNVPYFVGYTPTPGEDCILIHLDRGVKGRINSKKIAKALATTGGLLTGGIKGAINANIGTGILQSVANGIVKNKGKVHTLDNCIALCGFVNPNTKDKTIINTSLENMYANRYFDYVYPVGSVYVCAGTLPEHFTKFGREWNEVGAGTTDLPFALMGGDYQQRDVKHKHSVTYSAGEVAGATVVTSDQTTHTIGYSLHYWRRIK